MTDLRDELRRDIERSLNWASIDNLANTPDFELADKMIEAPYLSGYRKPRTITTAEELEALPEGSVVQGDWATYQRVLGSWVTFGGPGTVSVELPATVLHEPVAS